MSRVMALTTALIYTATLCAQAATSAPASDVIDGAKGLSLPQVAFSTYAPIAEKIPALFEKNHTSIPIYFFITPSTSVQSGTLPLDDATPPIALWKKERTKEFSEQRHISTPTARWMHAIARISHTHGKEGRSPFDQIFDIAKSQYPQDIGDERGRKGDRTDADDLSRECEKCGAASLPVTSMRETIAHAFIETPRLERLSFLALEDSPTALLASIPPISDSAFDFPSLPFFQLPTISPSNLPDLSPIEGAYTPIALPKLPPMRLEKPKVSFLLSFAPHIEQLRPSSLSAPRSHLSIPTVQDRIETQLQVEEAQAVSVTRVAIAIPRGACTPKLAPPIRVNRAVSRPFQPRTPLPTRRRPSYAPYTISYPTTVATVFTDAQPSLLSPFSYVPASPDIPLSGQEVHAHQAIGWKTTIALRLPYLKPTPLPRALTPLEEDISTELHKESVALSMEALPSSSRFVLGREGLDMWAVSSRVPAKLHLSKEPSLALVDPAVAFATEGASIERQLPSCEDKGADYFASARPQVTLPMEKSCASSLETAGEQLPLSAEGAAPSSTARSRKANKQLRKSAASLEELPQFAAVETIPFYNEFEPEVFVSPRNDGSGYYFAVALQPKSHLLFTSPPQNIVFIVDKSHSVKKHRFDVYRQGILKALSYIKDGDRFNIITADAKMRELSPEPLPVTSDTIRKAKEFLHKEHFSGYFDSHNPVAIFDKIYTIAKDHPSTHVVWLTNGSSLQTIAKNKNLLRSLKSRSRGSFSLYTATASQGNNLAMLDLISGVRQGTLLHTQTHASFPRQLAILTKKISNTVATEITMVPRKTKARVELFTRGGQPLHFTTLEPYVIYGTTDTLEDFELFMQGTVSNQAIDIKQHITFEGAKEAPHKMLKAIAQEQAHLLYDLYLREGKQSYLDEAKARLAPFGIATPFK